MLVLIQPSSMKPAGGRRHSWATTTLSLMAADHRAYGEIALELYRDLLDALLATLAEQLGEGWLPEYQAAWRRQASTMLATVRDSLAALRAANPHMGGQAEPIMINPPPSNADRLA